MLLLLLLAGCASRPATPAGPSVRPEVPDDAFITQRAVLTIRGRQFALNGYLARSRERGMRLIVAGNLGAPLADVLVKPDGRVFVMRSSPMFREEWIREHVAADLKSLFGDMPDGAVVTSPEPGVFRLERRRYQLEVRLVETRPGPQAAGLFEEGAAAP